MDPKVQSALDSLGAKRKEAKQLTCALERSLALQSLWPEVFEFGAVTTKWSELLRALPPQPQVVDGVFTITRPDGQQRRFLLAEVPQVLRYIPPQPRILG